MPPKFVSVPEVANAESLEKDNRHIPDAVRSSANVLRPRNNEKKSFNFENLQAEVRVAKITTSSQYGEEAPKKDWMSRKTLQKQPQWQAWEREGKKPWDEFLGREGKKELTFTELQAEVCTAGIVSSGQYREEGLKKGWASIEFLKKQPQWQAWVNEGKNPWDEFLGREGKKELTFDELQTEVRAAGIVSSGQYHEESPKKGWISSWLLKKQPQWQVWEKEGKNPWDEFLGREGKKELTFDELQTEVRAAGIVSSGQYGEESSKKEWIAYQTLQKQPQWQVWEKEGKNPWDEFLGREGKKELTFDELQTEVRTAGIVSSGQYEEASPKKGWVSRKILQKQPQWQAWVNEGKKPWDEFLGREGKKELTFTELQAEVRTAGIISSGQYMEASSKKGWIAAQTLQKQLQWQAWVKEGKNPWDEFTGREVFNFENFQAEVRTAGVVSSGQYTEEASKKGWIAASTLIKQPQWQAWVNEGKNPWDEFLGREGKKELTFDELQTEVRAAGIVSSSKYVEASPKKGWISNETLQKQQQWQAWVSEGKKPWDEFLGRGESIASLSQKLTGVLSSIENTSLETDSFRVLMSLFGTARVVDLLYAFHPDFKKLPVDYLKSELAKYLGDYMVVRSLNILDDVELALPYLGEKSFQESLFTVIKEDAIRYYQQEKKKHKEKEDTRILDQYVTLLKDKVILFHNDDFDEVVDQVESYIFSLTHDFDKPETVIHELSHGRTFPDLNQTINIKEVRDGRRVLIGDEMGMGKSASAILAKEYLTIGTALVVVPSNVISTWHGYLSDGVGQDGKQLGYFKKGRAPRVLEIGSVEDITKIHSEEFDYVVISHEKFNNEYAEKLKDSPIDMVIIDEVHKFKNVQDGVRSQALLDLMQQYKERDTYTVLLSGTPVPNKIQDLAVTLKLLYPEEFGEMDNAVLVSSIIKGDNINLRDLLFKKTQMKKLAESIDMPEKEEHQSFVGFSKQEQELYELLLEDDELTATEKLQTLRQFCLNPRKIFPDSEIQSSKVREAKLAVEKHFETNTKLVFFVNGYIDGIIRGENSILSQMQLPDDIMVKIIDGDVSKAERVAIEKDLKYMTQGKVLLVLSGMAADVGVDFSSAEGVYFYNEPWTKFDKMQQQARVYRPGLTHNITVDTSLIEGSVEEGIHYYLEMKYKAVMKLLEGVPLSEIEQSMLLLNEKISNDKTIEGDQGLAEEWLQSPVNRLNRFFGATKEIGEDKFIAFLEKYGEEYAEYYADMGSRGFQSNVARFVTSLIKHYKKEKGIEGVLTILDVASGPEMLRKRMNKDDAENLYSLDINKNHFTEQNWRQVVAGFTDTQFADNSIDYLNMSLAVHYSSFRPSRGEFERLLVFGEIARVLKVGGRSTINLVHSIEWKNREALKGLLEELGLKVVEDCTGLATLDDRFMSECLTFEKAKEVNLQEKIEALQNDTSELLNGLKIETKGKTKLRKSQEILKNFSLNGKDFEADLNEEDVKLLVEQEHIQEEGGLLIKQYGSVQEIPREELLKRSILRYVSGSNYKLVKKSSYTKAFIRVH
jgi:ubiquinone/menaquinone biosynthesis C-methylase UbiE